jgi:hypothetical protein
MTEAIALNGIDQFDAGLTEQVVGLTRPLVRRYFRSEVRGLVNIPPGAALVVSDHSGGMLTPDRSVFAVGYSDKYGYGRPLYTLAHDMIFNTPAAELLRRTGVIRAKRDNAAKALANGAVVMVFPGGDQDAYRPTTERHVIDFGVRTGYVVTAIEAGGADRPRRVGRRTGNPVLPVARHVAVACARADEARSQDRSQRNLADHIRLPVRAEHSRDAGELAVAHQDRDSGMPPIDIVARFGKHPDMDEVDGHIRWVMRSVLDELGRRRRLPVIG